MAATANTEEFKCKITHMYKNCPKDDGWFGCFAKKYGSSGGDIKLTGITNLPLTKDSQIEVIAEKIAENEYKAIHITMVTKTSKGMISYLASLPGISHVTARRLVTEYGADAIEMIKNHPDKVQTTLGLSDAKIKEMINNINKDNEINNLRKLLIEIQSPAIIVRIMNMINDPINTIKQDPYVLLQVPGITFQTVDAIALRFGEDPLSPYRVNHGLVHLLKSSGSNDMYINLSDPQQFIKLMVALENQMNIRFASEKEFRDRLKIFSSIKDSPIYIDVENNQEKLYLSDLYHEMMALVNIIKRKMTQTHTIAAPASNVQYYINNYEIANNINLTPEQTKCCKTSLNSPISIITGGPGRGKTSVIDCLASCWVNMHKLHTITLLAPTGKAMNKLKAATKSKYDTMTIDRLIVSSINQKTKTKHVSQNLNSSDHLFIIDESSMIDIVKATNLMALYSESSYCFVGDIDQLPPIMPGHFIKDLIRSGKVPVSYLTTPLRNSGFILSNAEKINNGDTDLQWDFTSMPFYPQPADNQTALDAIIEQYNDERENCADITQLALLCPMKKGITGAVNLNMTIQNIVCPENSNVTSVYDKNHKRNMFVQKGYPIKSTIYGNKDRYTRFRVGDIVMNTKNLNTTQTFMYSNNDYWNGSPIAHDMGIFNGDCGRIIAYIPSDSSSALNDKDNHEIIVVQFFDNRIANIDLTDGEFESFDLGYALTVHKSQGCEYQTVIYVSPHAILNLTKIGFGTKNLVYTAITRAKSRVVVMGSKDALNACIQTNAPDNNSDFALKLAKP